MNWIVKNFLRGLIIVVPIALTIYLIYVAFVRIDRLLQRMDAKGNGKDGVREYRVGARLVQRDSCRRIEATSTGKSSKLKPSLSKSSAARSAKV